LTLEEALRSIDLFTSEVVPLLRAKAAETETIARLADKPAGASV